MPRFCTREQTAAPIFFIIVLKKILDGQLGKRFATTV
jgi:hypothetical protein